MKFNGEKRCLNCCYWESNTPYTFRNDATGRCANEVFNHEVIIKTFPEDFERKNSMVDEIDKIEFEIHMSKRFCCQHFEHKKSERESKNNRKEELTYHDIEYILAANNLTPKQLADLLHVSKQSVSDWKSGHRKVPALAVVAMDALGLIWFE